MWLLVAASVVAGVSYQLVAPVMARILLANQLRICRKDPEFPLGDCDGSRVRLPLSMAWALPSMRLKSGGKGTSALFQFVFGFCHPLGALLISNSTSLQ